LTILQYSDYDNLSLSSTPQAVPTSAPQAPQPPAQEIVSDAPKFQAQDQQIVKREESVEYRDQDGNLLDEEQVKALEGKVEFKTRYETKTRVLDAAGNEIEVLQEEVAQAGVAPPHPDVEGANSETKQKAGSEEVPKEASSSKDGEKEAEHSLPKPASEGNEATVGEI